MKTIIGFQSDDENKIFVGKSYEKGLKNKNLIKNYQK